MSRAGGLVMVALLWVGCTPAPEPPALDAALVREWVEALYPLPMAERLSPPVASRLHGYAGLTLYEALRAADPEYRSLGGQLNGLAPLPEPPAAPHDWSTVAAEAERTVLAGLLETWALPSTLVLIDTLAEAQVERRARAGVAADVLDRSRAFGRVLADAILTRADADGFLETRGRPYTPPRGRGLWVNTTTLEEYAPISASEASQLVRLTNPSAALVPGAANARQMVLDRPSPEGEPVEDIDPTLALEPYWSGIMPWALAAADACRPPPPIVYSDESGSEFWQQVDSVYRTSMNLTEEQRTIALFWADNPGVTGTPPGHWVSIMRQLIWQLDLDPLPAAEMFALTGLAISDAFISAWAEKYASNVVRPVTYIRQHMDPLWETVVVTPPFPEYTSGHSVVSGAAAESLTRLLGTGVAFDDSTHVAAGIPTRHYASLDEAAKEASVSRLYGGIHYPMAIERGLDQGRCVTEALFGRVSTRASSY